MSRSIALLGLVLSSAILLLLPTVNGQCPKSSCLLAGTEAGYQELVTINYDDTTSSNNICGGQASLQQGSNVAITTDVFLPHQSTLDGVVDGNTIAINKQGVTTLSFGFTDGAAVNPTTFIINGKATIPSSAIPVGALTIAIQYAGGTPFTESINSISIITANGVCPNVAADPSFVGFHGQRYSVKGEPDAVFNLLSTPHLQFNSRFVSLQQQNQSSTTWQMQRIRSKHARLISDMKTGQQSALPVPPLTAGWGHPGTYMGASALLLAGSKLFVQPGKYESGFAAVTLNGVAVPVSSSSIAVSPEVMLSRSTPFTVEVITPEVRFSIVNADHFINLESAAMLSDSVSANISGLLGVSADPAWKASRTQEFIDHMEQDFKLASGDLFGTDFATSKYEQ